MSDGLAPNSGSFSRHPDFMRVLFSELLGSPGLLQLVSDVQFAETFEYYEDFIDFISEAGFSSAEACLRDIDPRSDQVFTQQCHVLLKLCAEYLAEFRPDNSLQKHERIAFDDLVLALAYGDMLGHLAGHPDESIWMRFEPIEPYAFGANLLRAVTHVIAETRDSDSWTHWKSRQIYLAAISRATHGDEETIDRHFRAFWNSSPDGDDLKSIRDASRLPAFRSFGRV